MKKEILYEGEYYDITNWIPYHPGGNVIKFYTKPGEDATAAVQQFHYRSKEKVFQILGSFQRRAPVEGETDFVESSRKLNDDFKKLHAEFVEAGMFRPCLWHVSYRLSELVILLCLSLYLIYRETPAAIVVGTVILAIFLGRVGWLEHEAGHRSLTGRPRLDKLIELIFFGLGDGLSATWWRSQHNRHHAMPQRLKRDVDLDTLPLLAFNSKVLKDSRLANWLHIRYQAYLFYVVDTILVITFWKFYHPIVAIQRQKPIEFLLMAIHMGLALTYIGFPIYFAAGWLASLYMLANFTLSHTHLPVTENPKHWVEFAFHHTMDINGSWWCNWWMGYLNYQIEHHLFPTMPQFRHPLIQQRVKEFAAKHGLPFRCTSYGKGVEMAFNNLKTVAGEVSRYQ